MSSLFNVYKYLRTVISKNEINIVEDFMLRLNPDHLILTFFFNIVTTM